jgi:acetyltransferase-like isoleucine patch superfamily enzyme
LIKDHRPYYIKKLDLWFRGFYVERFLKPHFDSLGDGYTFMKPWNVHVFGSPVKIGECVNVISAPDYTVRFTIWPEKKGMGSITVGNYCLICPGVRISSANSITIGDDCMIAGKAYITDSDWHGVYDRVTSMGNTAPVTIGNNVWIGDSVIVCKGVSIGDNSVIGASSVVTKDIPKNSIAAGNPAKVVRDIDPSKPMNKRSDWFANRDRLNKEHDELDRKMLEKNTMLGWFRYLLFPKRGD